MPYGYNGKILRIDLTTKKYKVEEPNWLFYRTYLGGRGLISYYLLKEVPAEVEPLSEKNKIIFATSIMTGAPLPGFGRQSIGAKSPLTGLYGESEAGGFWGVELKRAGFDAVIVEGKAERPSYIWIKDGKVEIKDASNVWGLDTGDAKDKIIEELGEEKLCVEIIGKAGENLVKIAGVSSDLSHYHGRTGMGAVMGSKNLKAIAVRGTQKIEFFNPGKIKELSKWFADNFKSNGDNAGQAKFGTSEYYFNNNSAGVEPTTNFTTGYFEGLDNQDVETFHTKYKIRTEGCFACPVRCKQVFEMKEPYTVDPRYGGPEFETLASFGSMCGVKELEAAVKAHELCNRYGLDTVSTGVTIAFAMECFEKGLITTEDTGGIELKLGNAKAMLEMIDMIAERRGFGNILAEGAKRTAEFIGQGSIKYAMQVKGQEFAMAEPRVKFGLGLAFALSPTGSDHLQAEHDGAFDPVLTGYSHDADEPSFFLKNIFPLGLLESVPSLSLGPEKVRLFTYLQHYWSLFNCIDACIFTFAPVRTFKIEQMPDMVEAVTGWNISLWELMKVGERATTMTKMFNIKNGASRKDDKLPDRMFEGLEGGTLKGSKLDKEEFNRAITLYYQMMGWDGKTGIPTEGKLHELNIGWILDYVNI